MPESYGSLQGDEKASDDIVDRALEKTGWSTLPTSAQNMNTFLKNAGVSGLSVRQLFNHPAESNTSDIHALILFYKWRPDKGHRAGWNPSKTPSMYGKSMWRPGIEDDSLRPGERIMFFNQTVNNASGTQALVATVLNMSEKSGRNFKLGSELTELKQFVMPMDPILRTAVVCGSDAVLEAHNKTAKQVSDGKEHTRDLDSKACETVLADEFWQYTIFLPDEKSGTVFEMEGMGAEVHVVGSMANVNWTHVIEDSINEKVDELRVREAPFHVYGIFDGSPTMSSDVSEHEDSTTQNGDFAHSNGIGSPKNPNNKKRGRAKSHSDDASCKRQTTALPDTEGKYRNQALSSSDMAMHSHDYTAFLIEMMKLMASRGDVRDIMQDCVEGEEAGAHRSEKEKSEPDAYEGADYAVEIEEEVEVEPEEAIEGDESSGPGPDGGRDSATPKEAATPVEDVFSDQTEDRSPENLKYESGDGRGGRSNERDVEEDSGSESSGGTSTDDD